MVIGRNCIVQPDYSASDMVKLGDGESL